MIHKNYFGSNPKLFSQPIKPSKNILWFLIIYFSQTTPRSVSSNFSILPFFNFVHIYRHFCAIRHTKNLSFFFITFLFAVELFRLSFFCVTQHFSPSTYNHKNNNNPSISTQTLWLSLLTFSPYTMPCRPIKRNQRISRRKENKFSELCECCKKTWHINLSL